MRTKLMLLALLALAGSAQAGDLPEGILLCGGLPISLLGSSESDVIVGTEADDVIYTGTGRDIIRGLGGNDTICGGAANDLISGDLGTDHIHGQSGDDVVIGRDGDDTLTGGVGMDSLFGDTGNDVLIGGAGSDFFRGQNPFVLGSAIESDICQIDAADSHKAIQNCQTIVSAQPGFEVPPGLQSVVISIPVAIELPGPPVGAPTAPTPPIIEPPDDGTVVVPPDDGSVVVPPDEGSVVVPPDEGSGGTVPPF